MDIKTFPLEFHRQHNDRYLVSVTLADMVAVMGGPVSVFYTNNMEAGAVAGHHYHEQKCEALMSADGLFEVLLVDTITRERLKMYLDSVPGSPHFRGIIVPPLVAHAVRNVSSHNGRLNVFATGVPRRVDDVHFLVSA